MLQNSHHPLSVYAVRASTQQWQLQPVWQMDLHQLTYRTIFRQLQEHLILAWKAAPLHWCTFRSSHTALSDSISFNVRTVKMSHITEHFQTHFENRQYFTWWNHCWNPSYLLTPTGGSGNTKGFSFLTPGKGTFQTCNSEAGLALGYKTRVGLAMLLQCGVKRTVKRYGVRYRHPLACLMLYKVKETP